MLAWKPFAPPPAASGRAGQTVAMCGQKAVLLGGFADREDDVSGMPAFAFDVSAREWVRSPVLLPKSVPPRNAGCTSLDAPSTTFVFGGEVVGAPSSTATDSLLQLEHRDGRMLGRLVARGEGAEWPAARRYHASCSIPLADLPGEVSPSSSSSSSSESKKPDADSKMGEEEGGASGAMASPTASVGAGVGAGAGAGASEEKAAAPVARPGTPGFRSPAQAHACMLVFGGSDVTGAPLGDLWMFNSRTKAWRQIKSTGTAPTARYYHSLTYCPQLRACVVFGGFDGVSRLGDTFVLKLADFRWECIGTPALAQPLTSPSKLKAAAAKAAAPSKLAAATVAASQASAFPDMPTARCCHTAVWARVPLFATTSRTPDTLRTIAPRILVVGGRDGRGLVEGSVFALDVEAGAWSRLRITSPLPGRSGHSAIVRACVCVRPDTLEAVSMDPGVLASPVKGRSAPSGLAQSGSVVHQSHTPRLGEEEHGVEEHGGRDSSAGSAAPTPVPTSVDAVPSSGADAVSSSVRPVSPSSPKPAGHGSPMMPSSARGAAGSKGASSVVTTTLGGTGAVTWGDADLPDHHSADALIVLCGTVGAAGAGAGAGAGESRGSGGGRDACAYVLELNPYAAWVGEKPQSGAVGWADAYTSAGDHYEGRMKRGERSGVGKCTYASGDVYEGVWSGGVRCGKGRCTLAGGDVYVGEWALDAPNGHGEMTYAKGGAKVSYIGEWASGKCNGVGECVYTNGDRYNGTWEQGLREGEGVCEFGAGGRYEGEWVRDVRAGAGVCTFANNDEFTGHWMNDQRSGEGVCRYANGTVYTGSWIKDGKCGTGTIRYANNDLYVGKFAGDVRCGRGECTYANGHVYSGLWSGDLPNGLGKLVKGVGGEVYNGEWVSGKRCGQGVSEEVSGSSYEGGWSDDVRSGSGTQVYYSGSPSVKVSTYVGDWEAGMRVGTGTCTYLDGRVYTGRWDKDVWFGQGRLAYGNGSVYAGAFVEGLQCGQGSLSVPRPTTDTGLKSYVGEWLQGTQNGIGESKYANGDLYTGEFANGVRCGRGVCISADGSRYNGSWSGDARNGFGTFQSPEGEAYDGEWKDNAMHVRRGTWRGMPGLFDTSLDATGTSTSLMRPT